MSFRSARRLLWLPREFNVEFENPPRHGMCVPHDACNLTPAIQNSKVIPMLNCKLPSPLAKLASAVSLSLLMGTVHATPIFADDFEAGLSQWNPVLTGAIATDPLNSSNKALTFRGEGSGGDTFTAAPYLAGGSYFLSFDVLGTCTTPGGNCGAFIGIDQYPGGEIWIAGDNTYNSVLYRMVNNGQWQHFEFAFSANAAGTFRLKVEDFVSGAAAGDVYFDNICISATAGDAGCPRTVPEPASLALVGMSLLGLAGLRRRRSV